MKSPSGQSTIEFIIIIAFMLLIFIMLVFLAWEKTTESNEFRTFIDAKKIAISITDNINTISRLGSGYYRYLSIPAGIYGNYEYEINITGNLVGITWGDYVWSDQMITSNVTIFCLDKGMNKKNRILNDNENILITCYRPDLGPVNATLKPYSAGANSSINVSIDVTNFGVRNAGSFVVLFNSQSTIVPGLDVDQTKTITVNLTTPESPGNYTIEIYVDSNNEINESIESDNLYNGTIRIQ